MERKVPVGISRRFAGTMTVRPMQLNFIWLPRCETNTKPLRSRVRITFTLECNLGMTERKAENLRLFYLCHRGKFRIFEIKFQSFL